MKDLIIKLKELKKQKNKAKRALAWKIECRFKLNKAKTEYDILRYQRAYDKACSKVTEYKGIEKQIKQLEKKIAKLKAPKKKVATAKAVQAKVKQSKELQAQIKATEEAIFKAELAERELEAKRREIEAKREAVRLEKEKLELAEQEVVIVKQQNATLEHKIELIKRQEALTEQYNILKAQIRQAQNLARVFTEKQKRDIYLNGGGVCAICDKAVVWQEFEADHIIPYSKGGTTTVDNGQCLCRACNRRKGAK